MPRRVRTRATRVADLDPALAAYLLDGDLRAALEDLRKREQPRLLLWLDHELAKLWQRHGAALEAEAGRRGIKPWWPQHAAAMAKRGPSVSGLGSVTPR